MVDRRTGNSYPVHALPGDENQNPAHNDRVGVGVGGAGGRRTLASRPTLVKMNAKDTQNEGKTETPKWLQDALGVSYRFFALDSRYSYCWAGERRIRHRRVQIHDPGALALHVLRRRRRRVAAPATEADDRKPWCKT